MKAGIIRLAKRVEAPVLSEFAQRGVMTLIS